MKELKILFIVVFFSAIVYIGVEPLAHSQMHPHVEPADYSFSDLPKISKVDSNITKGKELVSTNCTACHGISAIGINAPMDNKMSGESYGVVPPDLSSAGLIYDKKIRWECA